MSTPTKSKSKTAPAPAMKADAGGTATANATVGVGGELHQTTTAAASTMTTQTGTAIADNQNSLRAGVRGPTLLEDFILREKITHFDHERIPERVVHARGSAAHGYFQPHASFASMTKASFLSDPKKRTPIFARISAARAASICPVMCAALR